LEKYKHIVEKRTEVSSENYKIIDKFIQDRGITTLPCF